MKRFFAFILLLFAFAPLARADQAPSAAGLWQKTENGKPVAYILVVDHNGVFEGIVAKTFPEAGRPPGATCDKCTDDRKNAPVEGISFIRDMKRDGLKYEGGNVLDLRDGKVYSAMMTLGPDGQTLKLRGYMGMSMLGSDETWTRLPESAMAQIDPAIIAKYLPARAAAAEQEARVLRPRAAEEARGEIAKHPSLRPLSAEPSSSTATASGSPPQPSAAPNPPREAVQPASGANVQQSVEDAACRARMKSLGVVTSGPCIDVSDIVENLRTGEYSFNDPKKAYMGESFRIRLVLKTADQQSVQDKFKGLPGDVVTKEARFAQSLEATLTGDDFEIDPPGPLSRTATLAVPVEWEWKVTAKAGGQKTLTVEVAANIQAGPDKHRVQVTTLNEPITIEVTMLERATAYITEANSLFKAVSAALSALVVIFGFVRPARNWLLSAWRRLRNARRSNRAARAKEQGKVT